jgi:hypothetical protein
MPAILDAGRGSGRAEAPMRTRQANDTALRAWLARRLLAVLALALAMTIAAAGAALAAPSHPSGQRGSAPNAAAHAATAATHQTAQDGASPAVPLVFAGILLLAVASPTLPRCHSRHGHDCWERW